MTAERWSKRLAEFLPPFLSRQGVFEGLFDGAELLLHGSTSFGVDDAWSDLDVWLLLPDAQLARLDARSPTRFFEFELDGKLGHVNANSCEDFGARAQRCDMPLLAELRSARVLHDPAGRAAQRVALARRPMRPEVRAAWFQHHYVEMRGEHKASKNPTSRGDSLALLLFASAAIAHALRAALLLDDQPYPYDKWLAANARGTPTGARVEAFARDFLRLLAQDALRLCLPEPEHPLREAFKGMREVLVVAARARGIDGPWIDQWWLHIDASRAGIGRVSW